MIPAALVTEWERRAPWPTREQIEQDLLLSRLIVEIANDEYLGQELVFRGGTCLHKLHLPAPLRYSEDLDYVRTTGSGVGAILDAVRHIGESLGMKVNVQVTKHPKIRLRAPNEAGTGQLTVKIEMNTFERSPALPLQRLQHAVDSPWFTGEADVQTFDVAELVTTKIRALYQRSKGRDLFDLWLVLTSLGTAPDAIVGAFTPYRPDGYTAGLGEQNLRLKLENNDFRTDLDQLVTAWPDGYDIDVAAELVIEQLIQRVP